MSPRTAALPRRSLLIERLDAFSFLRVRGFDDVWYVRRTPVAKVPAGAKRVRFGQDPAAVFKIKRFAVFLAERLFTQVYPQALRQEACAEALLWFGWSDQEAFDLYLKKLLYIQLIEKVSGRYHVPDAEVLGDGGPDVGPWMRLFDRYCLEPVTAETVQRFMAEPASAAAPALAPWPGCSRLARAGAIIWYALRRLCRARSEPLRSKYALRWAGPAVWREGRLFHHFLFYNQLEESGDYRPENITFIFNPSELTAEDRRRLNRGGYRWLAEGEPCGMDRALARRVMRRAPGLLRFPEPVIRLFQKLLEHEHELSRTACEMYRETTEYASDSILKAAALERRGIASFNICHGDDFVHTEATCYIKLDRFFVWSPRQLDIFGYVWRGVKKLEVLGPFKNDYYRLPPAPEHAALIEKFRDHLRVAVFDTTFSEDAHITRGEVRRMYDDVLWALEQLPKRLIVIKSKLYNVGRIFEMEGFRDLGERLAGRPDVFVMDSGLPAQEAFKVAQIVIAFGPSTAGIEALCCGKDVLFYDTIRLVEHPFLKYPGVVYHDRESLLKRLQDLAGGGLYMEPRARQAMVEHEGALRDNYARAFAEAIGARSRP
ncbi:MAG: hypothetical protein HY921_13135 [Elusimicrobia bacterium]|nr:hypothetical protein [Elusimicrobiota bacterium]